MSEALIESVNKQVANWKVLDMKLHHFHWYVKGPQFFVLHEKFEELYNEAETNVDELAERILAIGGKPVSTLKECLQLSSIEEAVGNEKADEMIQSLVKDFSMLTGELKEGIALAEKNDDEVTADMLLSILQSLEKHIWMLQATLDQ